MDECCWFVFSLVPPSLWPLPRLRTRITSTVALAHRLPCHLNLRLLALLDQSVLQYVTLLLRQISDWHKGPYHENRGGEKQEFQIKI